MPSNEIRDQPEKTRLDDIDFRTLKSPIGLFGSGASQSAIAEHNDEEDRREKHEVELATRSRNARAPLNKQDAPEDWTTGVQTSGTHPGTNQTPTSLPIAGVQSASRTWPLQRAMPSSGNSPATPYAATHSPALPSSSVLEPSAGAVERAQAYKALPNELPSSSPFTAFEARQPVNAPTTQVGTIVTAHGDGRTKTEKSKKNLPKKTPTNSTCKKTSAAGSPTSSDIQLVADPDGSLPSGIPMDPSTRSDSSSTIAGDSEALAMDSSHIYQLEGEAKRLSQDAQPPKPPAKKPRAPRQRKKQDKAPASGRPNKKGSSVKATADGLQDAEASAEKKVDKPEPKQGRATRSRKQTTGGQKRKGTGMEAEVNASGSSGKGTGAIRNKKARVQKVEKDKVAHELAFQQQ